jgi:hypothetical protein
MNEWISVTERLPENGADVLVYDKNDWGIAWVNHDNVWVTEDRHINVSHIAYWSDIPELPKLDKPHLKDVDPVEVSSFVWRICISADFDWQLRQRLVKEVNPMLESLRAKNTYTQ